MTYYQAAVNGGKIAVDLTSRLLEDDLRKGCLVTVLPHGRRLRFHNAIAVSKAIRRSPTRIAFVERFDEEERRYGLERWEKWYGVFGGDARALFDRGF